MQSPLQPLFIVVTFPQTKERVHCGTRPKNGWEGDYCMRGTNPVYFAHMYSSQRENRQQDTGLSLFQINW